MLKTIVIMMMVVVAEKDHYNGEDNNDYNDDDEVEEKVKEVETEVVAFVSAVISSKSIEDLQFHPP